MNFRKKISVLTHIMPEKLPVGYQIIGNILLLKLPGLSEEEKYAVAKECTSLLPYVKTVCEMKGISGEFRIPEIKKIIGDDTVTVHKEHGILYKIDVSKIMFSKGNLNERIRLVSMIKPGEILVDMFAGIGYFSIPIAKFSHAKIIYSLEKNPVAYSYLKNNIELNRIKNIVPILGDCRDFRLKADRVIMGYMKNTKDFLPAASSMLKPGGMIHYHNIYRLCDLWHGPYEELHDYKILSKNIVKSYGPNIVHVVLDAVLQRS